MSRVVTRDFNREFKKHAQKARRLLLASAWLTENDGLSAVLRRPKADLQIQAIVGTSGGATSKQALKNLVKKFGIQCLRLKNEHPLFHPKLYVFQRTATDRVAWIGSMNFTWNGMNSNEEVMLLVDDPVAIDGLVDWFERSWRSLDGQDVKQAISQYVEKKNSPYRRLVDQQASNDTIPIFETGDTIAVRQRERDGNVLPKFVGDISFGASRVFWEGHPDLCAKLLAILSNRETQFFNELKKDDAFNNRKRNKPLICIAKSKEDAEKLLPSRPKKTGTWVRQITTCQNGQIWWMSTRFTWAQKFRNMVEVGEQVYERRTNNRIAIDLPRSLNP